MSITSTNNKNKGILHEYFFYQEKYTKMYGNNTIVCMRVGDFYELYQSDVQGFDLSKISEATNLIKTKKDKRIEKVSHSNPYMCGFQHASLQKYLKILVDNNFTVVIVDQVTLPPNPKRAVTGIYSAGTYINDNETIDSNNIICIYIEDEKQLNGGYLSCIGLSTVDLTTGECSVYEVFSNSGDEKYSLDEAYRFIISHNPKEVLITHKTLNDISIKKEQLLQYLELENKNVHYSTTINKVFEKPSYQNEFFGKIYKDKGMMSSIEYIDMEKMPYARLSLINLFDFVYKHNETFINNLDKPSIFSNSKHLILGNDAVFQLNILENKLLESTNTKFRSLFDVINHTSTAMGRRFIKNAICQPLNDINEIKLRYDCIDELLDDKQNKSLYLNIEAHLECIMDIERLGRKVFLGIIHPFEFANLIISFNEIDNIYKLIEKTKYNSQYKPDKKLITQVNDFLDICDKTFDITELKKQNLDNIFSSFFKKGVYTQIDDIDYAVANNIQMMKGICNVFATYIEDKKFTKKKNSTPKTPKTPKTSKNSKKLKNTKDDEDDNDNVDEDVDENENKDKDMDIEDMDMDIEDMNNGLIKLKKNDREGYYFCLTKRRSDMLKNNIANLETIKISDTLSIQTNKLVFKEATPNKAGKYSDTKIFFTDLNVKSDNVIHLKEKLIGIIKKKFSDLLVMFGSKYKDMFRQISQFIAKVDFIKSNAKTAKLYNYCKPELIINENNGFMNITKMRHPIIERIKTDIEYIPHNVRLGKSNIHTDSQELDGILLYGLNSAGKSSYMKAIGCNLIMAQCGMYVAAESYQYSPYESLFARITGNDNIFKGLSQFGLEMTELRAILKRNGPKTLVIGDEVCRGTEHISGNCIVATTIIKLAKSGCSFIFATHLHEIANMERIKNLKNVKTFHLSVEYDNKADLLVFDRILKTGSGSSVYGLTVARYIIKDDEFMKLAQEIMNELLDKPNELMSSKTSHFNGHVYVDACQICNKQNTIKEHIGHLDTHHINFQCNCNEDGFVIGKSYLPMNNKSNLIVLCKNCHYDVHHDKLEINGYKETSNGRIIDYKIINQQYESVHDDELITVIPKNLIKKKVLLKTQTQTNSIRSKSTSPKNLIS